MTPQTDADWRALYEQRGNELVAVRAALDLAWETNEQLQRDNRVVLRSHQTMREELGRRVGTAEALQHALSLCQQERNLRLDTDTSIKLRKIAERVQTAETENAALTDSVEQLQREKAELHARWDIAAAPLGRRAGEHE